jgi:hypothetical protein
MAMIPKRAASQLCPHSRHMEKTENIKRLNVLINTHTHTHAYIFQGSNTPFFPLVGWVLSTSIISDGWRSF